MELLEWRFGIRTAHLIALPNGTAEEFGLLNASGVAYEAYCDPSSYICQQVGPTFVTPPGLSYRYTAFFSADADRTYSFLNGQMYSTTPEPGTITLFLSGLLASRDGQHDCAFADITLVVLQMMLSSCCL